MISNDGDEVDEYNDLPPVLEHSVVTNDAPSLKKAAELGAFDLSSITTEIHVNDQLLSDE